jgi:tRNA (cytidine/uridine-2'-O-)-methyltransferase
LDAVPGRCWLFTAKAENDYTDVEFAPGDALVFGKETTGLDPEILASVPSEQWLRIPMDTPHVRSLNLAQCAAVALYEARRQLKVRGISPEEVEPK